MGQLHIEIHEVDDAGLVKRKDPDFDYRFNTLEEWLAAENYETPEYTATTTLVTTPAIGQHADETRYHCTVHAPRLCDDFAYDIVIATQDNAGFCWTCNGEGVIDCRVCSGTGMGCCDRSACLVCKGTGTRPCPDCEETSLDYEDC